MQGVCASMTTETQDQDIAQAVGMQASDGVVAPFNITVGHRFPRVMVWVSSAEQRYLADAHSAAE